MKNQQSSTGTSIESLPTDLKKYRLKQSVDIKLTRKGRHWTAFPLYICMPGEGHGSTATAAKNNLARCMVAQLELSLGVQESDPTYNLHKMTLNGDPARNLIGLNDCLQRI